jgi:outer membrane protein TolC
MQLTIPLGNVAARNRYKQGKVSVEQALLTTKKLEQDVMVQIDDAIKAAQTTFERVGATHQAKLYAEAALDAERKKLENGKSTSFVVLQLQRDLTAASSDEIRALADYNKALAQVAFAEASTLQRRKIDVRVQ